MTCRIAAVWDETSLNMHVQKRNRCHLPMETFTGICSHSWSSSDCLKDDSSQKVHCNQDTLRSRHWCKGIFYTAMSVSVFQAGIWWKASKAELIVIVQTSLIEEKKASYHVFCHNSIHTHTMTLLSSPEVLSVCALCPGLCLTYHWCIKCDWMNVKGAFIGYTQERFFFFVITLLQRPDKWSAAEMFSL